MITEEIKVNESKTLVLHIEPTTDKVHQVDIHISDSIIKEKIREPYGISKEEAIREYS